MRELYRSRSYSPRGRDERYPSAKYEIQERRTSGRFIRGQELALPTNADYEILVLGLLLYFNIWKCLCPSVMFLKDSDVSHRHFYYLGKEDFKRYNFINMNAKEEVRNAIVDYRNNTFYMSDFFTYTDLSY